MCQNKQTMNKIEQHNRKGFEAKYGLTTPQMHHTSENNKAGRAEFVFFGIILKIPNVRIR